LKKEGFGVSLHRKGGWIKLWGEEGDKSFVQKAILSGTPPRSGWSAWGKTEKKKKARVWERKRISSKQLPADAKGGGSKPCMSQRSLKTHEARKDIEQDL